MNLRQEIDSAFWLKIHRLPLRFVEQWQLRELKRVVGNAYSHIPLYQKLWTEYGIRPENIRTVADIQKLPVTSKFLFRQHSTEEWIDVSYPKRFVEWRETSGSTGEPFRVPTCWAHHLKNAYRGIDSSKHFVSYLARFLLWRGFSARQAWKYYGAVAEIRMDPERWGREYLHIPTAELRNRPMNVLERLRLFHPGILNSRSTLLLELARHIEKVPKKLKPTIDFLLAHGEMLMPSQRKYLNEVLGQEPYEMYGLSEVGPIALDCAMHQGLHLFEESFIVEILDIHNQLLSIGQEGRIMVTHFYNPVMPFIRYDTGDTGMILSEPCPCGLQTRRLIVSGRVGGFFTINGKRYNFSEFQMLLSRQQDTVLRYQLVKTAENNLELRIIPAKARFQKVSRFVQEQFMLKFGFAPEIRIVYDIPYTAGGKTQFIVDETAHSNL